MNSIQNFYNKNVELYHRIYISWIAFDEALFSFLKDNIKEFVGSKKKVLDVGCGGGTFSLALIRAARKNEIPAIRMYGVDFSKKMLSRFKLMAIKENIDITLNNADVLEGDAIPEQWGKFDLIISSGLFEYIPSDSISELLNILKERLSKKGKMLVFITKKNLLTAFFVGFLWKANLFSSNEVTKLFAKAGMKLEFKRFTGRHRGLNKYSLLFVATIA